MSDIPLDWDDFDESHPVLIEDDNDRAYEAAIAGLMDEAINDGWYPGWTPEDNEDEWVCEHGRIRTDSCLECMAEIPWC